MASDCFRDDPRSKLLLPMLHFFVHNYKDTMESVERVTLELDQARYATFLKTSRLERIIDDHKKTISMLHAANASLNWKVSEIDQLRTEIGQKAKVIHALRNELCDLKRLQKNTASLQMFF